MLTSDPLTNILRSGARQLLAQAVEVEAEAFLLAMKGLKLPDDDRLVRHGHRPERTIQTGIGPVVVERVKIRARAAAEDGERGSASPQRILRTTNLPLKFSVIIVVSASNEAVWEFPGFHRRRSAMRRTIFALTAIFFAPTAAMASATGGKLAGDSELGVAAAIQERQIAPGSAVAIGHRDFLGGNVILAKGDQSGTGPGAGGHKGQKKGGHHGKQKEGKDNKDKKS